MSNKGIKVKKARRKNVRDLQSPFGKNFAKYIAEIVTNSADSYKRLEEKNILDKRSDIVPSDLDEFYIALEQERLSESEYRVRVEEFKIKVKRAIQLPKEKLK